MAKKSQAATATVISITLPDGNELPLSGHIIVSRGDLSVVEQFEYSDVSGITEAMLKANGRLEAVELNPPPDDVKATTATDVLKKGNAKEKPAEGAPAQPELPTGETAGETEEPAETEEAEPAEVE